jgi:hypothetical protein
MVEVVTTGMMFVVMLTNVHTTFRENLSTHVAADIKRATNTNSEVPSDCLSL